jgi:hypothetical protein
VGRGEGRVLDGSRNASDDRGVREEGRIEHDRHSSMVDVADGCHEMRKMC